MKFRISTLMALILVVSCKQKPTTVPAYDRSFSGYIQSFTSGVISKKSEIRVHFINALDSSAMNGAHEELLSFNPEIKGKLFFPDKFTLAFTPEQDLEPGAIYNASLKLSQIIEVPDSLREFKFGFQVLRPDFEWGDLSLDALSDQNMEWYRLTGNILAADEANPEELEALVTVKVNGKPHPVTTMGTAANRIYQFTADSIRRTDLAQEVEVIPNTKQPGAAKMAITRLELPALGDFKFLTHNTKSGSNPALHLNFSDPLDKAQDLSGLITLEGISDLKFEISGTNIKVYPGTEVFGDVKVRIFKGIKNIAGHQLMNPSEFTVKFKDEKPRVEIIGQGNIIPVSKNLVLPFRAIGLKAVDVKVVKIPARNLHQFYQNNSYDGNNELYRVGEIAAEKTINLTAQGNLKSWNIYAVDLAEMIRPEPGAIYRVYFSFSQDYSLYTCEEEDPRDLDDEDEYYWYYDDYRDSRYSVYNYSDYYFNYPAGYSWRYRDNPCHVSYYNSDNFVVRNVMVTDLGLIVKKTSDRELDITVTDLVSAQPAANANVKVYNYQGRELGQVKTDQDGWANFSTEGNPYLVTAERGKHRTYLTVQNGNQLPVSNFPVGGNAVADGVKGFLYAERGVWRPGDSIFLNFILEDIQKTLPRNHPVIFELTDPRGMSVDRQVKNIGESRIYDITTLTAPSAPTGLYRAKIRIGEHSFEKSLRVEMVKPNRLAIELDLGDKVLKSADGQAPADLSVKWLTGIAARYVDVNIIATASELYQPFEKFKTWSFNDPVYRFERTESEVFNGAVGEDGKASINLDISNYGRVPGMLFGRFVVKAFEGGGDFSTQYFDSKIATYPRYIGMQIESPASYYYECGREYEVDVKSLDPDGEFIDGGELEVKVYTIGHYWWYSNRSGLSNYVNNDAKYLVETRTISTRNGEGKFKLSIPSQRWGRFLVRICDKDGGHCTGRLVYFDWPEEQRRNRQNEEGSTILSFRAEKEKYEIGETIKATIPADDGSSVLVTIENGSGILSKHWLKSVGGQVEFSTKATSEMAPNVYIAAHLIQPHAQTENDRPIRLYGIVAAEVYDPGTRLEPEIKIPEVWRPETTVEVEVSEKNGREMTYTLAVVDEGLLNLTNFKTPDPWEHFFAKEALGVSTWDMFDAVMGMFGGTLEQVFAIGGDSELMKSEKSNQNRFKPMVRHLGPFKLAANAKATHKVKIPNYVGSVKVMVVAADHQRAYGNAEKKAVVRKPLMVLTSLPRMLSPGDELSLPVTVFAMEDQVRNVNLKLTTRGLVDVKGEAEKSLKFTRNGEEVVDFRLSVPEERGAASVRIDAVSGKEKAYDETELKVRIPSAEETESFTFSLKPGRDTTLNYQPLGVAGGNSHVVVAATMPALDLEKRMKYLTGYPHGCTEQVVSRAFPMLYLEDLMELDQEMKLIRTQNITMALQHLYERQLSDGSFLYWPGYSGSAPNGYITTYAGHFLWEARAKGYQVPEGSISRWEKFQTSYARSWQPLYTSSGYFYNHLDQSYRLYMLALIGKPQIGAMNRLKTLLTDQENSLWYLAAAYEMAGQEEVAQDLASKANYSRSTNTRYSYYYYCRSDMRMDAIRLMVMRQLGQEAQALKVARKMALDINSNRWYSTHGLAYALRALLITYADNAKGGQMNWTFKSGDQSYTQKSDYSYDRYNVGRDPDEEYSYTLSNTGDITANFTVSRTGIPIRFEVPAQQSNLNIQVRYVDLNGNDIDVSQLRQGTQFEAIVSVSRMGAADGYEEMALTQIIPSGWEIVNTRVTGTENQQAEDYYQYRDIRDDRVYTYFSLKYDGTRRYRIRLNATYAGRFFMPPVKAEDMYDHEINANTAGRWVEVIRK